MKTQIKLSLACLALLSSISIAHANDCIPTGSVDVRDILRDTNGNPVHATNGTCVRTKWMNDYDACLGKPAPAPAILPIAREDRTVYFGFAKSSLTKEAKQRLTTLASELKARGTAIKSIKIAGFADRIGSTKVNERLSKKRADTVRKFLIAQGVTNIGVIETRWFGDSVSATKCPKKLKHADKIICLQPDRRVEVEVEYNVPTTQPTSITK